MAGLATILRPGGLLSIEVAYLVRLIERNEFDTVYHEHFMYYTVLSADAVLANSGHEPFGLVGLEVMAAGGIAFTGSTGEDYVLSFENAIALETEDHRRRTPVRRRHSRRAGGYLPRENRHRKDWRRSMRRATAPNQRTSGFRHLTSGAFDSNDVALLLH